MGIELLAPAKDKETAFAAIDCGADAVYIGANFFGARKNASNKLDDIKEVIDYAHKFWAKVHVTLNTILTDDELEQAVELAKNLYELGVDALIIQDMGLLKRLMEINLPLSIHASTQCDNYLPQKVKFFNDIGVTRVILARETPLDTIKQIHKENPNLELECFVHGALCVSFSGQCYLSQYIGGRSANRGECAQPCRKKYTVET
ncbi:MAG: U32 family peptidase, partial [bacterium]|nr:U32 family peptidase [bacterium]